VIDPASPVLLFDSGVGGLTVLAELRKLLPDMPVIYAADSAGLPYGTKTEAEIAARVSGLLGVLSERYRPRLATIACNTASTIALGMVRDVLRIPIVGTVPAIKPAAETSATGVIGLLGTAATIRQRYVDNLESEFAAGKRLIRFPAPGLVQAAEAKLRGDAVDYNEIEGAVAGLRGQPGGEDIDTVVLACTHFPLLNDELQEALGRNVRLIDGAAGIARRIASLVQGQPMARQAPDLAVFTGEPDTRRSFANVLSHYGLDRIERL
jgi:glutamate racemase